jgi:starvation-inducible outer membrane lipoprotein
MRKVRPLGNAVLSAMTIIVAMDKRPLKRIALLVVATLAAATGIVAADVSVQSADQAMAAGCWVTDIQGHNQFYDPCPTDTPPPPSTALAAGSMTEIFGEPNGIAVLSVGATNNTSRGYIQVLDCTNTAGAYSNLNADHPGQTISSLVITKLDAKGKACVYNHMATDVFVDLQGYLDPSAFTPDARRLKDTRTTPTAPPIAAGERIKFVGKPNGIAVVSIVGTQSIQRGYLQALPCGTANGVWSNVNLERANQTIANMAIVELDSNGEACVYTHGGAHVVVDLQGYLDPAAFTPDLSRALDTRGPLIPIAGSTTPFVAGSNGQLAVMSLVATQTLKRGFVQALPCNEANGAWSNPNTDHANQTIANLAIVPLNENGKTCVYTHGGAHLIADVQGYIDPTVFTPFNGRILDTRIVDDGSGGGDF